MAKDKDHLKTEPTIVEPVVPIKKDVVFTAEQMEVINQMIANVRKDGSSGEAISVYNKRDPNKIEFVKVSQFDGKFVLGFKDLQNNPYKKVPKYLEYKADVTRRLVDQPFITLLLSNDGNEVIEKEVSLIDFVNNRDKFEAKVVKIDKQEVILDHGILGRQSDQFGIAINDNGTPIAPTTIKAESKQLIMKFYVTLPGFEKPVEFIEAFLA